MLRPALAASLLCLTLGTAAAAPNVGPTISIDEIKPGMVGYGLTVFEGTKPDRFAVKVVAVMRNFLPKQDIILIRSDDPRLIHSGIAQGMSGSPIYFDNRLAGALAYGWGFARDPIAGVTPIAAMTRELERDLRSDESRPWPATQATAPHALPTTPDGLRPAAVPLQIAGMTPDAVAALGESLAPYHIVPQQAGGGRGPRTHKGTPARFSPGDAISVELIRGDISAVGTGTVTAVAGDRVLAFGHPMFNAGEVAFPISTATIHTFMASLSTSFKLSSPLDEAGALFQDRQSGIIGDMSRRVPMVPMNVTVHADGKKEQRFAVEIARHRFLTPLLVSSVLGSAAGTAASDVADATLTIKSRLGVRGQAPLELTDHLFAPDGVQARTLGASSGVRAIGDILFNPFSPTAIERIDVDVEVAYRVDVAEIVEASLSAETVDPGARPALRVTLRPFGKREETLSVPLYVPESLAGHTVKLTVQSGATARPDSAPPENLRELLDSMGRVYSSRSIVVSMEEPEEGLTLRGRLMPELPGSVLDSLRPSTAVRRSDSLKHVHREVVPTKLITVGKQELTLRVRERR
jgi:hypothetical protein